MVKENIWEYVISNTDIINIIGEYVSLQKKGKNYKACCPFHGEKTPSFVVSKEKGIFKCFGCNKSGNVIKFIEIKENLTSIEALKFLAKKQNLDISSFGNYLNKSNISLEHMKIFEVNNVASDFFKYQITFEKTYELENYLLKRKLTREIIKEFELGFSSSQKSIYAKLKSQGFDSFEIFNSSLVSSYENKNFFSDRLMFPIHDKFGNIVAFSGRDITNNSNPKYLNSAETIVFKKNEVIFNYYHAKDEITKTNEVYLVEGQFDCIALYRIGIKNTVAIMGTSLSPSHLAELSNKTINLFFDNDQAGIAATLKNLKMILYYSNKYNLTVNFVKNDLNKDPDELYKIDEGQTLNNLINNKIDIVEYLYDSFKKIFLLKLTEAQKFIKYKILFEYIFYINKQLVIILKQKLNKSNILTENLFDSYLKDFSKPNFPSDNSFIIKTKEYSKNSNHFAQKDNDSLNINEFYLKENLVSIENNDFQEKVVQKPKVFKKNKINNNKKYLSPQWNLLNDILITTLSQPNFAKEFSNEQFHTLLFENEIQPTRELISYIIQKNKLGKIVGMNNIISIIKKDIETTNDPLLRAKYEQYLNEANVIKDIELKNKNITEIEIYKKKIDELVDQKNKHNPKELITKKG